MHRNPSPDSTAIVVEGFRLDRRLVWHSSEIVHRIGARRLMSATGGVYTLMGMMDSQKQRNCGFSREFIAQFRSGFPENWKELVQHYLTSWPEPCVTLFVSHYHHHHRHLPTSILDPLLNLPRHRHHLQGSTDCLPQRQSQSTGSASASPSLVGMCRWHTRAVEMNQKSHYQCPS